MRIELNELIASYFESVKDKYPELSYENIRDIIIHPWNYIRDSMEDGMFHKIRIKYFGVLYVPPGRAKRLLEEAKYRFDKKYITPKQYFKIKSNIEKYLKDFENESNED